MNGDTVTAYPAKTELDALDHELVPMAFVDCALHVYVFAAVRPETMIGLDVPDDDCVVPPSLEVHAAVCDVMSAPFDEPAENATDTRPPVKAVAPESVGAAGTATGVTAFDDTDALLVPASFVAVTVNV